MIFKIHVLYYKSLCGLPRLGPMSHVPCQRKRRRRRIYLIITLFFPGRSSQISSSQLNVGPQKVQICTPSSMSTSNLPRQLTTSRIPGRLLFGISRFSTHRQLLASGRSPQIKKLARERKREADQNGLLRNLPPRETSSTPTVVKLPKALLVDAQRAGLLSVSPQEAMNILNEFNGMRLRSGSPEDLCLSENCGRCISLYFTNYG